MTPSLDGALSEKHVPRLLGGGGHMGRAREGVPSVEGRQRTLASQEERPPAPMSPSDEDTSEDKGPAGDRRREEYLDALFRELEDDPRDRAFRTKAGSLLMGSGLVLIVVGCLAIVVLEPSVSLVSLLFAVSVLALSWVAAGLLLLPEEASAVPGAWSAQPRRRRRRAARGKRHSTFLHLPNGRALRKT